MRAARGETLAVPDSARTDRWPGGEVPLPGDDPAGERSAQIWSGRARGVLVIKIAKSPDLSILNK